LEIAERARHSIRTLQDHDDIKSLFAVIESLLPTSSER
jgi:hypothetical protein